MDWLRPATTKRNFAVRLGVRRTVWQTLHRNVSHCRDCCRRGQNGKRNGKRNLLPAIETRHGADPRIYRFNRLPERPQALRALHKHLAGLVVRPLLQIDP